ncbi:opsin-3-like [Culicoides brevitarsis]|uniref:opsin-3-like n=1 Tax=Culicoides brevitarsis TaxID=469753 RepID=UPI00307C1F45
MEINNATSKIIAMAQQQWQTGNNVRLLGWNLPVEEQELVHAHWRQFEAPPYYAHLLLALLYFILMVCSTTGNGLVLWIFSSSKPLRSSGSNLLILNLAVFDLLMMLEMPLFLVNSFREKLWGGMIGCDYYAALGSLSGIGGAVTNAAIAYDRYRTISRPLDGKMSKAQAGLLCLFTWFWAMPFTLMPLLRIWGRYIPEGFLTTCSFDYLTESRDTQVFVGAIFTWAYAIPIFCIVLFYYKLFGHVQAHEKLMRDQARKMNVTSLAANKDMSATSVEIRIAKASFTIFFLFLMAWTPYGAVAMIGAFGNKQLLTPLATMIPALFCKTVSCLDPWIYAASHPKYRKELEKRMPWLGIRENDSDVGSEARSQVSNMTESCEKANQPI